MTIYITTLLLPYFQYNSLNIQRLTFLNIYFVPFSHSPNIGKMRVKIVRKRTIFSTIRAPTPTNLWFSIVFSHWNACYQDPNKTVHALLFFSNIFWIICFFYCFHSKCNFKICQSIATKTEYCNSLLEKSRARFCTAAC